MKASAGSFRQGGFNSLLCFVPQLNRTHHKPKALSFKTQTFFKISSIKSGFSAASIYWDQTILFRDIGNPASHRKHEPFPLHISPSWHVATHACNNRGQNSPVSKPAGRTGSSIWHGSSVPARNGLLLCSSYRKSVRPRYYVCWLSCNRKSKSVNFSPKLAPSL